MMPQDCPPMPPDESWMATYGDAITLLMAFFVLLMSFAKVDLEVFDAVSNGIGAHMAKEDRKSEKDHLTKAMKIMMVSEGAEQVAKIVDALWCDSTVVVVSSDLSHFHNYDTAVRLDAETADAVVNGRPQDLDERRACGHLAIQGLMIAAERLGRSITLIDLRNSGDTNGPRDEVVGYGAFCST